MTVYARSDISSVSISAAHGGCGQTHIRPAPGGKPEPTWGLSCPHCEPYLLQDDLWAPLTSKLPETPDEISLREEKDRRSEEQLKQDNTKAFQQLADAAKGNTMAMSKIVELIQLLAPSQAVAAGPSNVVQGKVEGANDLSAMTLKQLWALSKERGIQPPEGQRDKASLVQLLSR